MVPKEGNMTKDQYLDSHVAPGKVQDLKSTNLDTTDLGMEPIKFDQGIVKTKHLQAQG